MKLAAVVLVLWVGVYALALGWSTGVWAAVAASMAAVLAALYIWLVNFNITGRRPPAYTGERNSDGKPHGQGSVTYADGETYSGQFKDGERNGQGTYTYADGTVVYTGEWKGGKRHGQGTEDCGDGETYSGEFKDGKFNGQGTYTGTYGNNTYTGEWKDGKPAP